MINKNNKCIIRQEGFYYSVKGNDALIFNKFMGYNLYGINDYKTGFPIMGAETVLNKFNNFSIDYDLLSSKGTLIKTKRFPVNHYEIIDKSQYPLPIIRTSVKKEKMYSKIKHSSNKVKNSKFNLYRQILQFIADGISPYTGEIINGLDSETKNYLLEIIEYFETKIEQQEKIEETCNNAGQSWSTNEDNRLITEYNERISIKEIAKLHSRSEGAIKARLLRLLNLNTITNIKHENRHPQTKQIYPSSIAYKGNKWLEQSNNSIQQQNKSKSNYSKTNQSWSPDEDKKLIEEYNKNIPIKDIAQLHNRSNIAVHSRLISLLNNNQDININAQTKHVIPEITNTYTNNTQTDKNEERKLDEPVKTAPKSCKNCMEIKNGNCFGRSEICEDFKFSPTISEKERANWPKYGDATAFRKGEKR